MFNIANNKIQNIETLRAICTNVDQSWFRINQWRSKGGQVGARALGRRPWERNSILFAVILNVFLNINLDQSMLKNGYFCEKTGKNHLSIGGSAPNPCLPPAAGDSAPRPTCCSSRLYITAFVKCILFRSKKNQVTTANVLPLLLLHFCTYFLIKTL